MVAPEVFETMDPLQIININSLMAVTSGRPEIVIGIIDGPVEVSHPDLQGARLQTVSPASGARCKAVEIPACQHGTFIAGMLYARRGSQAPAISPDCTVMLRPIFCEVASSGQSCPEVTPQELASAIIETVGAGARVINLSLGLSTPAMLDHRELRESSDYAFHKGTLLIAASGNQGHIGPVSLFTHPWIIPVAACDPQGRPEPSSNIGLSVGKKGLMSPGVGVTSTSATVGYTQMSGTSVAVPFVTGTIALL